MSPATAPPLAMDESTIYRDIIDDLTRQNQRLKARLRHYEPPVQQSRHLHDDKVFQVQLFDPLPSHRRLELEAFLASFAQSLREPQATTLHSPAVAAPLPTPLPPPIAPSHVTRSARSSPRSSHKQLVQQVEQQVPHQTSTRTWSILQHESSRATTSPLVTLLSDQQRLAAPSFSGFEPPSHMGTGTGMRMSPPLEVPAACRSVSDAESQSDQSALVATPAQQAVASTIASILTRLFHDSMRSPGAAFDPTSFTHNPSPLPKESGTNQAYMRNMVQAFAANGGWFYLALVVGMAQLHEFSVTMPFIREAVQRYAPSLELSSDGSLIRFVGSEHAKATLEDQTPRRESSTQSQCRPSCNVQRSDGSSTDLTGGMFGSGSTSEARVSTTLTSLDSGACRNAALDTTSKSGICHATASTNPRDSEVPSIPLYQNQHMSSNNGAAVVRISHNHVLVTRPKADEPARKRLKTGFSTSSVAEKRREIELSLSYIPRFGNPSENDLDEVEENDNDGWLQNDSGAGIRDASLSGAEGGMTSVTQRKRRRGCQPSFGTLSFYCTDSTTFCSDLTQISPTSLLKLKTTGRSAECSTLGADDCGCEVEVTEVEVVRPLKVELQTSIFGQPDLLFNQIKHDLDATNHNTETLDSFDDATWTFDDVLGMSRICVKDQVHQSHIELESLISSGMTNSVISDNFSIVVLSQIGTSSHAGAVDAGVKRFSRGTQGRVGKYSDMDMSPAADLFRLIASLPVHDTLPRPLKWTCETIHQRKISHLPSTRQRHIWIPPLPTSICSSSQATESIADDEVQYSQCGGYETCRESVEVDGKSHLKKTHELDHHHFFNTGNQYDQSVLSRFQMSSHIHPSPSSDTSGRLPLQHGEVGKAKKVSFQSRAPQRNQRLGIETTQGAVVVGGESSSNMELDYVMSLQLPFTWSSRPGFNQYSVACSSGESKSSMISSNDY